MSSNFPSLGRKTSTSIWETVFSKYNFLSRSQMIGGTNQPIVIQTAPIQAQAQQQPVTQTQPLQQVWLLLEKTLERSSNDLFVRSTSSRSKARGERGNVRDLERKQMGAFLYFLVTWGFQYVLDPHVSCDWGLFVVPISHLCNNTSYLTVVHILALEYFVSYPAWCVCLSETHDTSCYVFMFTKYLYSIKFSDQCPGLWLVETDHVTWILASDWSSSWQMRMTPYPPFLQDSGVIFAQNFSTEL